MAQRSSGSKTRRTKSAKASGRGHQALDQLHDSIEAAEAALKDLRSEMSRESRTLLKDVDATLRDARKNIRSVRSRVAKELEQVQQGRDRQEAGDQAQAGHQAQAGGSLHDAKDHYAPQAGQEGGGGEEVGPNPCPRSSRPRRGSPLRSSRV